MSFIYVKNFKYFGLLYLRDYCEIRIDLYKYVELRKVDICFLDISGYVILKIIIVIRG